MDGMKLAVYTIKSRTSIELISFGDEVVKWTRCLEHIKELGACFSLKKIIVATIVSNTIDQILSIRYCTLVLLAYENSQQKDKIDRFFQKLAH